MKVLVLAIEKDIGQLRVLVGAIYIARVVSICLRARASETFVSKFSLHALD